MAAIRAAQWGLKPVVIEKDPFLGGTCLHVGCIPTKVLLYHAELYENFRRASEFGIQVSDVKIDWPVMLARKEKIVRKHAKGIEFLFRKNKVESVQGWGRWAGPGRVAVERDGQTTEVEAANIMLATGSEARTIPGVEFDGQVIVGNRQILELPRIPKTLVVVGAGAVGLEFASMFNSFGSEVFLLEMLPRIAPLEDEEVSAELEKIFRRRRIKIFTGAKVDSIERHSAEAAVTFPRRRGRAAHDHRRARAAGSGTRAQERGAGLGENARPDGTRIHLRESPNGNGRARFVRHRRHRRGDAAACARRLDGRNRRSGTHGRERSAASRTHAHS